MIKEIEKVREENRETLKLNEEMRRKQKEDIKAVEDKLKRQEEELKESNKRKVELMRKNHDV